jgi:uncharacterized zinc-type alcohol dehydrogenase-like protein
MSFPTRAYATHASSSQLHLWELERRALEADDVLIDILFCGVCHSDLHQARDEWGGSVFPMVPGHEIVGTVLSVGTGVSKWKIGDKVGVGVFVDSCRTCPQCQAGEEQYCDEGMTATYNAQARDGSGPTYGGYSTQIVVQEDYIVSIPEGLPLDAAAPLLCAGITTYSPLRYFGVKPGDSVAVVGLGGLGHMGVKFAKAFGAHVTVLSHSPSKREAALALGADDFLATGDEATFAGHQKKFDLILDTVSAEHDLNSYLGLLKINGTMVLVGLPNPSVVSAFSLVGGRRSLAGSMIGGIKETQEMLNFCAEKGIVCEIELIAMDYINQAFHRMLNSDVRYRFVIDLATLKA